MMTILLRLFAVLFLSVISRVAFATDFTDGTAVANHTDLSVNYLGQIFGSVGNVLQGSSGQMLGQLFYKLNEGIVVVAGLWLCYTVFTVVLRSAQEGSFMGANKNVALVFLKIALGFSLLLPNPSTGYSLLQGIVMKVVVQGVGLADDTWKYGLEYINNGGVVWHRPEQSGGDAMTSLMTGSSIVSSIIDAPTVTAILGGSTENKKGPGQQIFANAVCMYSSIDNQSQSTTSNTNMGLAVNGVPPVQYDVIENTAAHQYDFPGVGNKEPLGPGSNNCGTVSWNIQGACSAGDVQCTMAKQSVSELVNGLLPAAKKYYCSQHSTAPSCLGASATNVASDNEQLFFSAIVNYINVLLPLVQLKTGEAHSAQKGFIKQAEIDGWLTAGRYYWDLSQVQYYYNTLSNIGSYAPSATPPVLSGAPLTDANNAMHDAYGYMDPGVLSLVSSYDNAQTAGDTGNNSPNWNTNDFDAGTGLVSSIFGGIIGDVANLIQLFETGGNGGLMGPDPIVFLHEVGMSCIGIAADIWFGFLGVIVAIMLLAGFCHAEYDATPAIKAAMDWIKPLLMVVAVGFWGVGFILGFYVPMYPYLIYTFGIVGWIIAVIEAMVAAPLVCFGLTHPEGHDFLGEAKQALMLLLGIFLRPVLMVIGLIAAMILSYVALRLLVYTFSGFITDLFYQSSPASGPASGNILSAAGTFMGNAMASAATVSFSGMVMCLLVFPLTLVVFTGLVYVTTTQCYSLIFALPDNILRWIGMTPHGSHAAEMARQVYGIAGSMGSSVGSAMKEQVAAGEQSAKELRGRQMGTKNEGKDTKNKKS